MPAPHEIGLNDGDDAETLKDLGVEPAAGELLEEAIIFWQARRQAIHLCRNTIFLWITRYQPAAYEARQCSYTCS
ncbi:unnamed protein product [Lasius platythorax]|uniref:Uncharacterized protein n=1 Tax=Lasius platythorax TaxID=488582 RepID=A0AAV2NCI7_9HYME